MPFYYRYPRLAEQYYLGRRATFVTICCAGRQPVFAEVGAGQWAVRELLQAATRHGFLVHAYCLMPDHLHVVAVGKEENSNLSRFVDSFKQKTGYAYKQRERKQLWQTRFYDHILRSADAIEDVAGYVWMNPVRKGLCAEASAYPLSGSQTMEWMNFRQSDRTWVPPWRMEKGPG